MIVFLEGEYSPKEITVPSLVTDIHPISTATRICYVRADTTCSAPGIVQRASSVSASCIFWRLCMAAQQGPLRRSDSHSSSTAPAGKGKALKNAQPWRHVQSSQQQGGYKAGTMAGRIVARQAFWDQFLIWVQHNYVLAGGEVSISVWSHLSLWSRARSSSDTRVRIWSVTTPSTDE